MFRATQSELMEFSREAAQRIARMREKAAELCDCPEEGRAELVNALFRDMHSLKGAADALGLSPIVTLAHKSEDLLDLVRSKRILPDERFKAIFKSCLDNASRIAGNPQVSRMVDLGPFVRAIEDFVRRAGPPGAA